MADGTEGTMRGRVALVTGAGAGSGRASYEQLAALHPMHRLGRVEEIAAAVLGPCSDGASFLTGEHLVVDGGYASR